MSGVRAEHHASIWISMKSCRWPNKINDRLLLRHASSNLSIVSRPSPGMRDVSTLKRIFGMPCLPLLEIKLRQLPSFVCTALLLF